ncbi:MAG: DNA-binding protein [Betaproteobacteria bacterium]|nr:DNA-binding protein [Betaproteobacteria bacterium]
MVTKNPLPSVPLANDPRFSLATSEAAALLNRKPQTLRFWACKGCGPIKPLKINGRLAWPISALRELLGVTP